MPSQTRLARLAGALYLLLAVLGVFAQLVVRERILVAGDAAATTANIMSDPVLFRQALVADILMATVWVLTAVALYWLLRDVDGHAGLIMVTFTSVGSGMILVNLVFHYAGLLMATDPAFAKVDRETMVLFFTELHEYGYILGGIFFGLWLLPLGYLVHRSRRFPRPLGILLAIASVVYIVDTVLWFAAPNIGASAHELISAPVTIAELWLILYLLIRGVGDASNTGTRAGQGQVAAST